MSKRKKVLSAVMAGLVFVGGIVAGSVTGFFAKLFGKNSDLEQSKKDVKSNDSVTTNVDEETMKLLKGNIDDLGVDLQLSPEETASLYGNVETFSSDVEINPEDIVEVVDPNTGETVLYVNDGAASK